MTLLTLWARSHAPLMICLALGACSEGFAGPVEPASPPDVAPAVAEFVLLVNDHRQTVGCPALRWNADVATVAQAHSDDMVARGFFDHTNPDGASPGNRLTAAAVDWSRWAENIAWGYTTGGAVLDGWLNSSGHRANIETCELLEHGVGLRDQVWTHVFMTP